MNKKFFITTPIYYANGMPHLGNAYPSFIADVMARYKRLLGYDVKFSTGTDENGQKMTESATKVGKDVMIFLDEIAHQHQQLWDDLEISYTDFIRTTEHRHRDFVQKVLQKTYDQGDIYLGEYEGLYCIGCEGFKKETDLVMDDDTTELVCPDHRKPPQRIKEKNYFFKLSKYQQQLESFFSQHPVFLEPDYRYNEVKSFVAQGLEDFSISREGSSFGIPLPFDSGHVTYIWYDALLNYLTVCQGADEEFGKNMFHVLGKDISRFHAIFRPAMLMAAGMTDFLPHKEFINGFFTVDGQKMGKSLGNTIDPRQTSLDYSRDALVFYLFYDINVGADGDFSRERFNGMYEGMLLGGRGNLVSRVTKLSEKNQITQGLFDQKLFSEFFVNNEHLGLSPLLDPSTPYQEKVSLIERYLDHGNLTGLLRDRYSLVQYANKCMQDTAPRTLIKEGKIEQSNNVLQHLLYTINILSVIASPFLIHGFAKTQKILNNQHLSEIDTKKTFSGLENILCSATQIMNLSPDILYERKEAVN